MDTADLFMYAGGHSGPKGFTLKNCGRILHLIRKRTCTSCAEILVADGHKKTPTVNWCSLSKLQSGRWSDSSKSEK